MSGARRPGPPGDPIFYFFREAMLTLPDATRIYLIRHAQSQGNTGEDLTTGDPDLTDIGWEQAKRLGERMRDQKLQAIYASPKSRPRRSHARPGGLRHPQAPTGRPGKHRRAHHLRRHLGRLPR
jgi:hypothetical protein